MKRLEGTVRKRWLKRTREQRKNLLLSAWPNMAALHRPDIEAFRREPPGNPEYREAYMWPHVNLEDLLNPKLLLIFLNARGRHPPHAFIQADWASVDFGRATTNIIRALMENHVMIFTGRTTPDTYGEFVQCDNDRAFEPESGREMNPGDGLLSLEIQERLYRFLVDCCMLLLPEYTRESILQADIPIQPEPPVITTSESGLDLLSVVAAEAPYRLPARLDIDRLHSIVAAKKSAAEDHIWALREDPGYFLEALLERKEHRPELVPDARGQLHPSTKPFAIKKLWNNIISGVVSDAYFQLGLWAEINDQLEVIERLMTKHAAVIRPENDLPRALEWRFMKLIWLLERMVRGPIINLKMGFPPSPPIRSFFLRAPPQYGQDNIRTMPKDSWVADKKRSRLSWIMTTLWDEKDRPLAGLTNLTDELQRLIENDKYIRDRHVDQWSQFEKSMDGDFFGEFCDPTDGRFNYPVDKRRTKETTIQMQQAEAALDEFWKQVDLRLVNKKNMSQHATVRGLLSQSHIRTRTPDWVEPAKDADLDVPEESNLPISVLYYELDKRTQRTLDVEKLEPAREKVKTRGTASRGADDIEEPSHGPDIQPTFTVDKRAYKVFTTLFYVPSRTSQPGEIPWTDFLHAMVSTGFRVEKLYGSIWQFSPQRLDVERSIQFHEPHPSGKILFRTARRHGRRLFRAYGWHSGMFKLEE
ncbi:hypothetical protein BO94DRAFT_563841 [Aspergillus sclerotioniger CBS 115572]|uniref:Uncharacterized protein n=1 Tax=Aspergillus sclerotioniger CBS 115572 TaxID=1450535 RepID=A0A317X4D3_9EURO|nr:hypothetical protein BO94DRAFT_563841 [Aspergillus sclerotioniger CBS 115572]PWY93426.1 hypothetical protein BO94DRAFT_563841 [Aspergillus sclerotioniger CBS 115572]